MKMRSVISSQSLFPASLSTLALPTDKPREECLLAAPSVHYFISLINQR